MGRIARHIDLSWEVPGLRADVDVPLESPAIMVSGLAAWAGAEPPDGLGRPSREESPARRWLTPPSAALAWIPLFRGHRRTRRGR